MGVAMKLSHEVVINKPIQEVWDYANNPDNLALWLNDYLRSEHLTGDPDAPKVGDTSNQVYKQPGGEFTMLEEITAYDPPNHIKLFMTSKQFDMEILNDSKRSNPARRGCSRRPTLSASA